MQEDEKLRASILKGVLTEQERQAAVGRLRGFPTDQREVLRATWACDITALEEVAKICRERRGGSELIAEPWRHSSWERLEQQTQRFLELLRVQYEIVDEKLNRPSRP